jgi:protocatechuate 3,4-dioxygenase beta subunit
MTPPKKITEKLTRREMLGLMGLAGAAAAAAACGTSSKPAATATGTPGAAATAAAATPTASAISCVVSPTMTVGPYFVDEQLNRSDIRADPASGAVKEGAPLRLAITIQSVRGDSCTPVIGAYVDIWHCDAAGLYSDVPQNNTVGQKFLRGYQLTDDNGAVEFTTIYPGWYMGRAVHIHIKVRTNPSGRGAVAAYEFTSQLFFDQSVTNQVYTQAPYSAHGQQDTTNDADNIYQGGGNQMLLKLGPEGQGYVGAINIGMETA